MTTRRFNIDGMLVWAEHPRLAVKYYRAIVNRVPDYIEHIDGEGKLVVVGTCVETGMGVFATDTEDTDYHRTESGGVVLTPHAVEGVFK